MANYQLEQTGAEVQALLNAVESPDTTPTAGSSNLITSGAVQAAVAGVSAEVTALEHKVDGLEIPVTESRKAINLSGGIGTVIPSPNASSLSYSRISVSPGDMIIVNGTGGNGPRLWGFIDSSQRILSVADMAATEVNLHLIAPTNAAEIIINNSNASAVSYYVPKGSLKEQVENISLDIVFDITEYNGGTTYASLSSALSAIPSGNRIPGMTVKYVDTSTSEYKQFRHIKKTTTGFTTASNWQGVDDIPASGSRNLVESGGVFSAMATESARVDKKIDDNFLLLDKAEGLIWEVDFNGTNGYCTLNSPIVLSQNGDSIEFVLRVDEAAVSFPNGHGYAFALGGASNGIGIGVNKANIAVHLDDGTWIQNQGTSEDEQVIKIEYADNKIKLYRGGQVRQTYNGQSTLTIYGFGHSNDSYGYWDGVIRSIKVNGVEYNLVQNFVPYNVTLDRDGGYLTPTQEDKLNKMSLPPIVIVPVSATQFNVKVLNSNTKEYLTHTFVYDYATREIDGETYVTEDVWTASEIRDKDGNVLFQGNLNMIYKVGKVNGVLATDPSVNEDYHIGISHGLEVAQMQKFFADGEEFNPATLDHQITCSAFRMILKSECYVVDSSIDTGNSNNYPKLEDGDMIVHAIHFLDATYTVDNLIKWYNRLYQVRDAAIQYLMVCGGMVSGFITQDNPAYALLNDVSNSWNEVTTDGVDVTYSAPSGYVSQSLKGQTILSDTVIMYGDKYILHQRMLNEDNAMQRHSCTYTMNNNNSSVKCYMQPVRTTYLSNPDTFNEGDVIAVYMERKIETK